LSVQETLMNLNLSSEIAKSYSSPAQRIRVMTEELDPSRPTPKTTSISLYADSEFASSDLGEVSLHGCDE
jgi:hypothetical protein